MGRFLAGVLSTLLLVTAGLFLWRAQADRTPLIPPVPAAAAEAPMGVADLAPPPQASERSREEKRFARYDRDRNGAVGRDEYLFNRHRAFERLDVNHDGRIDFAEYAAKGAAKFTAADRDRNGALNAAEFATTRIVRKSAPKRRCPPAAPMRETSEEES